MVLLDSRGFNSPCRPVICCISAFFIKKSRLIKAFEQENRDHKLSRIDVVELLSRLKTYYAACIYLSMYNVLNVNATTSEIIFV